MTNPDGKVDANRTIQIDLDDVRNELEISDVDPATIAAAFTPVTEREDGPRSRQAPPPLPPPPSGEATPAATAPAERRPTRFYVALVLAFLAVGVVGGALAAKSRSRAPAATAKAASTNAPAATVIGIPTVEIRDTPSDSTENR
jgi:hypothetical protein